MSPEQAAGRRVGPPSDVYSAGVVLYELLAGENPLRGATAAETLSNVVGHRLPPLGELRPDLAEELAELVDDACRAQPIERPAAAELSDALRDVLESGALGASGLRRAQRLVRPLGRAAELVERGGGAALAGVTAAVVLSRLPAYPASWTLPLLALAIAVWAVVPQAGLAWLLAMLAFPLFNVSFSVGTAYLGFAVVLFLATRHRPVSAVWPTLALLLTPVYLTLLAPAGAAVLGRVPRPAHGRLGRRRDALLPAARARAPRPLHRLPAEGPPGARPRRRRAPARRGLGRAAASSSPGRASCRWRRGRRWRSRSAPRCASGGVETRLWLWALGFAVVFTVYRAVPIAVWEYQATLAELLASVALSAAVVLLPLLLWSGPTPEGPIDEHAEIG